MSINYTPKLGLPLIDDTEVGWGDEARAAHQTVEDRLTKIFAGDPNTNVSGDYVGQRCLDTTNFQYWFCAQIGNAASAIWARLSVIADQMANSSIPLSKLAGPLPNVPVGTVIFYIAPVAPDPTWVLMHGQELSRVTFAALFALIGTTYGIGDGSNTFNIPDVRGRVIAGLDNMGGVSAGRLTGLRPQGVDASALGATGGEQAHTQTLLELFPHAHSQWDATGNHANMVSNTFSAASNPNGGQTSSTGGGEPMNVVQPTIGLNVLLKVLP